MFKKITVLSCSIILALLCFFVNNKPIFYNYGNEYSVYTNDNSSCANVIKVTKANYFLIANKFGESCLVAKSNFSIQECEKRFRAKLVFSESTKEGVSYYYYSNKIKYQKIVNGKKINLHIFVGDRVCKLGTPLIFDSF